MSGSRIDVINQIEFSPREWLRREVLWASLMVPYRQQREDWLNGNAYGYYSGNVSRHQISALSSDAESQALAFLNQGKTIAGLISSIALFETINLKLLDASPIETLGVQADSIDKVLGNIALNSSIETTEELEKIAFDECYHFVKKASEEPDRSREYLAYADRIITELATNETQSWIATSRQNEEGSLPVLVVQDGGYPRSAGGRVDRLQPIFRQIIESEQYQLAA
jgi:hypothetical protein